MLLHIVFMGSFRFSSLVRMVFRSFLSPRLGRTFLPLRSKVLSLWGQCCPLPPVDKHTPLQFYLSKIWYSSLQSIPLPVNDYTCVV